MESRQFISENDQPVHASSHSQVDDPNQQVFDEQKEQIKSLIKNLNNDIKKCRTCLFLVWKDQIYVMVQKRLALEAVKNTNNLAEMQKVAALKLQSPDVVAGRHSRTKQKLEEIVSINTLASAQRLIMNTN